MSNKLPTTARHFRMPKHPSGATTRPIQKLYHKQGKFFVGWGPGATEEPVGLEYEIYGSDFGWLRIARGESPDYVMDDPSKRTQERDELGDLDRTLWLIGSDGKPLDPWKRVAQLYLVRVRDGTRLIFETNAPSAIAEVEDLVSRICWLARDKAPDARPVMVTSTKQVRNAKGQSWWIPVFTIVRWNEPDGTEMPPESKPQQTPGIEQPTPAARPSGDALLALGGVPLATPRARKHRNAYAGMHAKPTAKPRTALEDDLDDEVPY